MQTNPREWLRPELVRPWTEFVVVTALVLSMPIMASTLGAYHHAGHRFMELIANDRALLRSIVSESLLLALFLFYLSWRGWTAADLHIRLDVIGSLQGLGLYLGGYVALIVGFVYSVFLFQIATHSSNSPFDLVKSQIPAHGLQVSWLSILVAMVINAFFEEIIFTAFIFTQVAERRGPILAFIVTIFLRGACHTYQDPFHLAGVVTLFACYTATYWLTRNLWPLIFAHLLLDISSISFLKLAAH